MAEQKSSSIQGLTSSEQAKGGMMADVDTDINPDFNTFFQKGELTQRIKRLLRLLIVIVVCTLTSISCFIWKLNGIFWSFIEDRVPEFEDDSDTLITMSGSGCLLFYYQGMKAYLESKYDMTKVTWAGISGGSFTAAFAGMNLPARDSLFLGMKFIRDRQRYVSFTFLMDPATFRRHLAQWCEEEGIGKADLDWEVEHHKCIIGITNIFPPRHQLKRDFRSIDELARLLSCSMRVFPFFSLPIGWSGDCLCVDGGLSAWFSVPRHYNEDRVIRVTPFSILKYIPKWLIGGINIASKYSLWQMVEPVGESFLQDQFVTGYEDAAHYDRMGLFQAKGMTVKKSKALTLEEWKVFVNKTWLYLKRNPYMLKPESESN